MLSSYFLTLVDAGVIGTFPSHSAVAGEMWGIRGRLLRDDRGIGIGIGKRVTQLLNQLMN